MAKAKHPSKYSLQINGLLMLKECNFQHCKSSSDVMEVCGKMAGMSQEAFVVITLNARNNIIDVHLATLGLVDASLVHPREVFRHALLDGASALVLVHNHPSGCPQASAEDIAITRKLVDTGRIIDIPVLDHVIVGGKIDDKESQHYSMKEEGVVAFN